MEFLKNLLRSGELDDEDENELNNDIHAYSAIINSSKYTDSHSNTEALEKLMSAMKLATTNSNPKIVSSLSSEKQQAVVDANSGVNENANANTNANAPEKPDTQAKSSLYDTEGRTRFIDLLSDHLNLLEVLEGEADSVLPAEPAYRRPRFGKEGGKNFSLMRFDIPCQIYNALHRNNLDGLRINSPICEDNYIHRYQTLLWLEEAHQAIEMRRYDQKDQLLAKYDDTLFLLHVPGLAEGRPSLMRGDKLILRSDRRSNVYEGQIYEVRENDILFRLHHSLQSMDGLRFDVSFLHSRTSFRRCHHGVFQFKENQKLLQNVAFPRSLTSDQMSKPMIEMKENSGYDLRCFMRALNEYQRKAVINILKGECHPAPYIVFGPPGTGKTVTLVEAVLQVYARKQRSRILVCGNSNACVDLIAERIQSSELIPKNQLLRVSAFWRMDVIPPELDEITLDMDNISSNMYSNRRVILTTCIQAGALYEFKNLFDYVFIDEAGHANEPEAMVPIGLLKPDGCSVLAGDPHQLGPVCMSKVAERNGLGSSLLDRLSRRSVYKQQSRSGKMVYDERYLTKLIICYRSDPRVMVVNNELFYGNELKFKNSTPKKWLELLKIDTPLVFHNVKGRDRREYLNPSWFNPNEAITCLTYVNRLYKSGLLPSQLGIITPYRRQIEKLNLLFDDCKLRRCKIATMEEFQGDEREVIIISTVRTREKNMLFDKKFNLGFLFNPKRFNVAISRAKWMVIVIGDEQILNKDDCWIKYKEKAHRFESTSAKEANRK